MRHASPSEFAPRPQMPLFGAEAEERTATQTATTTSALGLPSPRSKRQRAVAVVAATAAADDDDELVVVSSEETGSTATGISALSGYMGRRLARAQHRDRQPRFAGSDTSGTPEGTAPVASHPPPSRRRHGRLAVPSASPDMATIVALAAPGDPSDESAAYPCTPPDQGVPPRSSPPRIIAAKRQRSRVATASGSSARSRSARSLFPLCGAAEAEEEEPVHVGAHLAVTCSALDDEDETARGLLSVENSSQRGRAGSPGRTGLLAETSALLGYSPSPVAAAASPKRRASRLGIAGSLGVSKSDGGSPQRPLRSNASITSSSRVSRCAAVPAGSLTPQRLERSSPSRELTPKSKAVPPTGASPGMRATPARHPSSASNKLSRSHSPSPAAEATASALRTPSCNFVAKGAPALSSGAQGGTPGDSISAGPRFASSAVVAPIDSPLLLESADTTYVSRKSAYLHTASSATAGSAPPTSSLHSLKPDSGGRKDAASRDSFFIGADGGTPGVRRSSLVPTGPLALPELINLLPSSTTTARSGGTAPTSSGAFVRHRSAQAVDLLQ